jgi:oligopeptide transport system substrate-binding protein
MLNKNRRLSMVIIIAMLVALVVPMANISQAAALKTISLAGVQGTGDIPSLDPALATDTASAQVNTETYYPLVRGLETDLGKILPGLASKWVISPDGLTYTFTIRNDVPWVMWDGKQVSQVKDTSGKVLMVNAHDFEYGWKYAASPVTASQYGFIFGEANIVGADAYNSSKETGAALTKLADAMGVKATDDNTLVVTVTQPGAFILGMFALSQFDAMPKAVIEKFADKWTEPGNAWAYGPYVVREWKHTESLTMTKNPFWPGVDNSPKPTIDEVTMPFLDQTPAFANYEAGTTDVVEIPPITELDRIKADPVLSKEYSVSPSTCSYYYGFNVNKAPVDDVHLRLAFSYAVDRQSIVDNVTKGGQEPARWFGRPGAVAVPTMKDSPTLGIGYDPEMAKKELATYLAEKKITVDQIPPITLMSNQVESHTAIAQAIQQMWQDTLGIKVEYATQDWKTFLKTRSTDAPQIFRDAWCQDYADADSYDREVFRSTSGQNDPKYKSPDFDKLVDAAAAEPDVAKRTELYRQAENLLVVKDAAIIPIYWYTNTWMTKPYVTRTFSQTSGDERLEKWDITKTS